MLKPCPFCDTSNSVHIIPVSNVGAREYFAVICDNCLAQGPRAPVEFEAVRGWHQARRHLGYEDIVGVPPNVDFADDAPMTAKEFLDAIQEA